MNFSVSEDVEAVRSLSEQILGDACAPEHLTQLEHDEGGDGYDAALWQALADANLLGVAIPEPHGGSALGLSALYALLEEAGRTTAAAPLLPTLVYGALPIARFGTEAQQQRWLPGVARGEIRLTAAFEEFGNDDPKRPGTRATTDGDDFVINGEKVCVPAVAGAARILVPARLEGGDVALFLLDPASAGVAIEAGTATNWERQSRLSLTDVRVSRDDLLGEQQNATEAIAWLEDRALTALCAVQLGVSQAALKMTAAYTSTRKQFGREIATFQAISMRTADAFIDIEAMRSTFWQAAWRLENELPSETEVAAAKWWACRGGNRVAHTAQHLHGGMGSDVDYPIHRYFLWAKQLELTLGGAGVHLARIGRALAETPAN
jgi:alkylation response protein AidB-like acyl-CoA dehydrogenase